MLRVLRKVTHSKVCDQKNTTVLRSSIEQTSHFYQTQLPCINDPNINDDDRILTHEPTSNPWEQIATKAHPTNEAPGSKNGVNRSTDNNGESLSGDVNVVEKNGNDETPASKNGINCNNKNGIAIIKMGLIAIMD